MKWPTIESLDFKWQDGEIVIEPGSIHEIPFELIVSNKVQTVLVYSLFFNSRWGSDSPDAKGWRTTSIYSLRDSQRQESDVLEEKTWTW